MKLYSVGGSIRDTLMGLTPNDYDYVVVGVTPNEMEAAGFKQVGKDFPVYLHPHTGEEYALARIERKSGLKHTDFETIFDTSVTIEDDLMRRDLTCNSIAQVFGTNEFIDPFNGIQDIKDKVLRHTTEAFKEDPLRILRLARFSARFPTFTVAPETKVMVTEMVANGDLDHISPDRIWMETKKALLSTDPNKYFEFLSDIRAFKYVSNTIYDRYIDAEYMTALVESTKDFTDDKKLLLRGALFFSGAYYESKNVYDRDFVDKLKSLKVPANIIALALFCGKHYDDICIRINQSTSTKDIVTYFNIFKLRSMVGRNPDFIHDLCCIIQASDGASSSHLAKLAHLMMAYLDTKDFLACRVKRHKWEFNVDMSSEQYQDAIHDIQYENVDCARYFVFDSIQLDIDTASESYGNLFVKKGQDL